MFRSETFIEERRRRKRGGEEKTRRLGPPENLGT